jgi:hypothetical protein
LGLLAGLSRITNQRAVASLRRCLASRGLGYHPDSYQSEDFERHQAAEGVVKMEMVVVITVTFFIGALVYMVGQALRH